MIHWFGRQAAIGGRRGVGVKITIALWVLFGLGYALSPAHAAGNAFARQGAKLFAAQSGGAPIGAIMPGTPLDTGTSQLSDTRLKTAVTGWVVEGDSTVLYKAPDLRIIMLRLDGDGSGQLKVLGKQQDSYGTTWEHVAVTGWVPAADVTPNVGTVWAAAKKIYDARCSSCHALHAPDEFTANQWPGVLRTMARNADLNPSERELVTQYLQAHAQKP